MRVGQSGPFHSQTTQVGQDQFAKNKARIEEILRKIETELKALQQQDNTSKGLDRKRLEKRYAIIALQKAYDLLKTFPVSKIDLSQQGQWFLSQLDEYKKFVRGSMTDFDQSLLLASNQAFRDCCALFYDNEETITQVMTHEELERQPTSLPTKEFTQAVIQSFASENFDLPTVIEDLKKDEFSILDPNQKHIFFKILLQYLATQLKEQSYDTYKPLIAILLEQGMPLAMLLPTLSHDSTVSAVLEEYEYIQRPSQITTLADFECVTTFLTTRNRNTELVELYDKRKEQLIFWAIQDNYKNFAKILTLLSKDNRLDFLTALSKKNYMPLIDSYDQFNKYWVCLISDEERDLVYVYYTAVLLNLVVQPPPKSIREILALLPPKNRLDFLRTLCQKNLIPTQDHQQFQVVWQCLNSDEEHALIYKNYKEKLVDWASTNLTHYSVTRFSQSLPLDTRFDFLETLTQKPEIVLFDKNFDFLNCWQGLSRGQKDNLYTLCKQRLLEWAIKNPFTCFTQLPPLLINKKIEPLLSEDQYQLLVAEIYENLKETFIQQATDLKIFTYVLQNLSADQQLDFLQACEEQNQLQCIQSYDNFKQVQQLLKSEEAKARLATGYIPYSDLQNFPDFIIFLKDTPDDLRHIFLNNIAKKEHVALNSSGDYDQFEQVWGGFFSRKDRDDIKEILDNSKSHSLNKINQKQIPFLKCITNYDQFEQVWRMLTLEERAVIYDACHPHFTRWVPNYAELTQGVTADFLRSYIIENGVEAIKGSAYIHAVIKDTVKTQGQTIDRNEQRYRDTQNIIEARIREDIRAGVRNHIEKEIREESRKIIEPQVRNESASWQNEVYLHKIETRQQEMWREAEEEVRQEIREAYYKEIRNKVEDQWRSRSTHLGLSEADRYAAEQEIERQLNILVSKEIKTEENKRKITDRAEQKRAKFLSKNKDKLLQQQGYLTEAALAAHITHETDRRVEQNISEHQREIETRVEQKMADKEYSIANQERIPRQTRPNVEEEIHARVQKELALTFSKEALQKSAIQELVIVRAKLFPDTFNLIPFLNYLPERDQKQFLQSHLKECLPCIKAWARQEAQITTGVGIQTTLVKKILYNYLRDFLIIYDMLRDMQHNLLFTKTNTWAKHKWYKETLHQDHNTTLDTCAQLVERIDTVYKYAEDHEHSRTAQALKLLEKWYQTQNDPNAKAILLKEALITAHRSSHLFAMTTLNFKEIAANTTPEVTTYHNRSRSFISSHKLTLFLQSKKGIAPNKDAGTTIDTTYLRHLSTMPALGSA